MTLPNFPNNPTVGQQFSVGSTTYECTVTGASPQWRVLSQADKGLRVDLGVVGSTVPVSGVPAKRLANLLQGFNVKDYGAKGDGVVDDTSAIQAAVNAAASSDYNIPVIIPTGIYKISSTIFLDTGTRVPSIIGAGSAETTLITDGSFGSAVPLLSIVRTSGNRVSNRTFKGFTLRDLSGVAHGMSLQWVSQCIFDDVGLYNLATGISCLDTVFSCEFRQIKSEVPTGPSVVLRDESNQLLFSNCILTGGTEGVKILGSFSAIKFNNCDFEHGSSNHLMVTPVAGKKGRGLSVDTCYFENGSTFSVYILPEDANGVEGFSITNSYFIVQPAASVVGPFLFRNCQGGLVEGNTAHRFTSYLYNRDGTASKLVVQNNIYDCPALTNLGDIDGASVGNLLVNNSTGLKISNGLGSPEGVLTAVKGSLYLRSDGGAATSLYVKESGTGNTGWIAK